jgi:hypothetical protein
MKIHYLIMMKILGWCGRPWSETWQRAQGSRPPATLSKAWKQYGSTFAQEFGNTFFYEDLSVTECILIENFINY